MCGQGTASDAARRAAAIQGADRSAQSCLDVLDGLFIMKQLGPKAGAQLLASRLCSLSHYFVLRKNLMEPEAAPVRHAMQMTPIDECGLRGILGSLEGLEPAERRDLLGYLLFYRSGFKNCYVMRREGQVAYMQTLIYPEENAVIEQKYRRKFYPLKESQVMIENVFTFLPFRGLGCLQSGTRQLLDLARSQGYRSAVCYIRKDRIVSLNEFVKMGFRITRIMPEYKLFGKVWRGL
jgi:hypothetical protein